MNSETDKAFALRLGAAVRAARTAQGLTLKQVHALSGVGVSHISFLEKGGARMSLFIFVRLCTALQADPAALIRAASQHP